MSKRNIFEMLIIAIITLLIILLIIKALPSEQQNTIPYIQQPLCTLEYQKYSDFAQFGVELPGFSPYVVTETINTYPFINKDNCNKLKYQCNHYNSTENEFNMKCNWNEIRNSCNCRRFINA